MKKQLRIEYKDGVKVKVTNKNGNTEVFKRYLQSVNLTRVKNCAIYTYPLKSNPPFVLVEDREINKENAEDFLM
ncbi:hypothetical protein [Eubacterium limosum]|uniref:hypothetical protein n=1 Tax=Eubacterium limosum TaxID=1736 RepID=UPI0010634C29|nr:hypothetical protein [Eubacterium limosum]